MPIIVSFSYIYISQDSVATKLSCAKIFNNHFIANCPHNVSAKEFRKSINVWQKYERRQSGTFFGTPCRL